MRSGSSVVLGPVGLAALVEYSVQKRSSNESLVEFRAAARVVPEEPRADQVTGEGSDNDRSDAKRSSPEAVPGLQQPPDHRSDRYPTQNRRNPNPCHFRRECHSLQKRVQRRA